MEDIQAMIADQTWQALLIDYAIKLVIALAIYVIGMWIAKWIKRAFDRTLAARGVDEMLREFLGNILFAALMVVVILAALDALGVPITSALAIFGAAGLAIGLALKDSLGNFAAGVMIIMFRPFRDGDYVEVAGVSGSVTEVKVFQTILLTPDNKQVIIPNGQITNSPITNYSAMDTRRVDLVIGVGYDDDLKAARDVLEGILRDHDKVLGEPAFVVAVAELGDSSVNFNVRPWVKTEDYWGVYSDVLEQSKVKLEAAGCSIPFPQRDVHLFQENSGGNGGGDPGNG